MTYREFFKARHDNLIPAKKLVSTLGKAAIVTDYLSQANGYGAIPKVAGAVPIWGITEGSLGLGATICKLIADIEPLISKGSKSKMAERAVLDFLSAASNIQLMVKSFEALATGTVMPVYYGFAITNGIQFATNFYLFAKNELAIRDARKTSIDDVALLKDRNLYVRLMVADALNCIGFTCLTLGNPVGFAFLGVTTVKTLQETFAPNFFNRSIFNNKDNKSSAPGDQQRPPSPGPAK